VSDARHGDALFSDRPIRVAVAGADDLEVVSMLAHDALGLSGEISWMARQRRLAMPINRFRWEDRDLAARTGRPFERVRAAIVVDNVLRVRALGLDPRRTDTVFSVLSITFEPGEDGAGTLSFALAGDGELALDVEALDMRLFDLTRPWEACGVPEHDPD